MSSVLLTVPSHPLAIDPSSIALAQFSASGSSTTQTAAQGGGAPHNGVLPMVSFVSIPSSSATGVSVTPLSMLQHNGDRYVSARPLLHDSSEQHQECNRQQSFPFINFPSPPLMPRNCNSTHQSINALMLSSLPEPAAEMASSYDRCSSTSKDQQEDDAGGKQNVKSDHSRSSNSVDQQEIAEAIEWVVACCRRDGVKN